MPTKKSFDDSTNRSTPARDAENVVAALNKIVNDDDTTIPPLGTPYGEALRDSAASATSTPPPYAALPQRPPYAAPPQPPLHAAAPPPMAKAAAAGKSFGLDLLKTAARAAVWFGVFLVLDGDPVPDPDDFG